MVVSSDCRKGGQKTHPDFSEGIRLKPSLGGTPPSSPIIGYKRKRSHTSDTIQRQLSPSSCAEHERSPSPENLDPRCQTCGLPCWCCYSAKKFVKRIGEGVAEQAEDMPEEERRSMNPPPLPTSSAYLSDSSQSSEQSTVSKRSRSKRKRCEEKGLVYIGPKDANFHDDILAKCGFVAIYYVALGSSPEKVYKPISPAPQSRVFLQKSEAELQSTNDDFIEFKLRNYDEHTLTTICHDSIVLRDHFQKTVEWGEDAQEFRSVRRDRWRPHLEGPKIPGDACVFDWDIEPDTTYSVSTKMFTVPHRRALRHQRHLLADFASVAPYLTLEYKCLEKTGKESEAICQIAAASVLWLYRRNRVRQAAQLSTSTDNLRHYAITIMDEKYTIRETRFEGEFYVMRKLATGDLTLEGDLKRYIEWSNMIHAWGLGPNATSFRDDAIELLEPETQT